MVDQNFTSEEIARWIMELIMELWVDRIMEEVLALYRLKITECVQGAEVLKTLLYVLLFQ
jgi:hypothetical protein